MEEQESWNDDLAQKERGKDLTTQGRGGGEEQQNEGGSKDRETNPPKNNQKKITKKTHNADKKESLDSWLLS